MPGIKVAVKGLGKVLFPDGTSQEQILDALEKATGRTRLERAADMGFSDRTWYHGTGGDIEEFRPKNFKLKPSSHYYDFGIHAGDARTASEYALYSDFPSHSKGMSSGMVQGSQTVYPVRVRGNILDITKGIPDDVLNELKTIAEEKAGMTKRSKYVQLADVDPNSFMGVLQRKIGRRTLQDYFRGKGYDGIKYKWGGDNVVMFDPKNIRSVNAAFDPEKKDSANILAGIGGGAVGLGAMYQTPESRADEMLQPQQTIEAAKYPALLQMAKYMRKVELPTGRVFEALPDLLDKWAYGAGDVTFEDELRAALEVGI